MNRNLIALKLIGDCIINEPMEFVRHPVLFHYWTTTTTKNDWLLIELGNGVRGAAASELTRAADASESAATAAARHAPPQAAVVLPDSPLKGVTPTALTSSSSPVSTRPKQQSFHHNESKGIRQSIRPHQPIKWTVSAITRFRVLDVFQCISITRSTEFFTAFLTVYYILQSLYQVQVQVLF